MSKKLYPFQVSAFSPRSYGGRNVCSRCHEKQPVFMTKTNGGMAYCADCAVERRGYYSVKINGVYFQFYDKTNTLPHSMYVTHNANYAPTMSRNNARELAAHVRTWCRNHDFEGAVVEVRVNPTA